jgi:hypothetical protein
MPSVDEEAAKIQKRGEQQVELVGLGSYRDGSRRRNRQTPASLGLSIWAICPGEGIAEASVSV